MTTNEELRPIVEAATGGEWEYAGIAYDDHGGRYNSVVVAKTREEVCGEYGPSAEDAAFIATFNPAKVKAMLDQIDALTGALQMAKHIVDANGTQAQLDEVFAALESVGVKP